MNESMATEPAFRVTYYDGGKDRVTYIKTDDPMILPGAVKYGGLGAFLALCAPGEVLVHNQMGSGTGQLSRAAYEAAGASNKLNRNSAKLDAAKVVEWLVK